MKHRAPITLLLAILLPCLPAAAAAEEDEAYQGVSGQEENAEEPGEEAATTEVEEAQPQEEEKEPAPPPPASPPSKGPGKGKTDTPPKAQPEVQQTRSMPCAKEDLNWNPGSGGPATAVAGQAYRVQPAGSIISYRARASQLSQRGSFGFYTDSHGNPYMRLSDKPCEVAMKVGPCEASYGSVTLSYITQARAKELKIAPNSGVCVLPSPAGKYGGEDFWWLNVATPGPCPGGVTWFGGGKLGEGQCARAVLHKPDVPSGQPVPAGPGTGSGGGGGSTGGGAGGGPDCWTAKNGRTCCKVMFSPVPAECQASGSRAGR